MRIPRTPFNRALFGHLAKARQRLRHPQKPWRADWEDLLQKSEILSAEDRDEALRNALELQRDDWVHLHFSKGAGHPHKILIPIEREREWFTEFNGVHPADIPDDKAAMSAMDWVNELRFLATTQTALGLIDLLPMQEFFMQNGQNRPMVPIKERSLQIFGNEKRLDELRNTTIFDEGRLTLEALRCFVVPEPLPWNKGSTPDLPLIVIENAATWHSYCQWNALHHVFSGVVYGCGKRFMDSVSSLHPILKETGNPEKVFYFGDLDPAGLRIPRVASERAVRLSLPEVEPHAWSYQQLLKIGRPHPTEEELVCNWDDVCWLGSQARSVEKLFRKNQWIPQEYVGWEFLCHVIPWRWNV